MTETGFTKTRLHTIDQRCRVSCVCVDAWTVLCSGATQIRTAKTLPALGRPHPLSSTRVVLHEAKRSSESCCSSHQLLSPPRLRSSPLREHVGSSRGRHADPNMTTTSQRGPSTLALLGLLVGFVNVDAFRLIPVSSPGMGSPSALGRAATNPARSRECSTTWRTAHRGLSMSTLSALDEFSATDEVDGSPSRASVMDELDAILGGDAQAVRGAISDLRWRSVPVLGSCIIVLLLLYMGWCVRSARVDGGRRGTPPQPPPLCAHMNLLLCSLAWHVLQG